MNKKKLLELKPFLEEKFKQYNTTQWIDSDPICIPHGFSKKEDIEISAFIIATLAWGNRKTIINKGNELMEIMGNSPHDFVINYTKNQELPEFKHRTFNSIDLDFLVSGLQEIYQNHNGLENVLLPTTKERNYFEAIDRMRSIFLGLTHEKRSEKHISSPAAGSAAKRIIMFLRWMVRNDNSGVDFGIWHSHSPTKLSCPLDVHSAKIARSLKLLKRKQNDRKAVEELDVSLRILNAEDPSRYDFTLFGLSAFEDWK